MITEFLENNIREKVTQGVILKPDGTYELFDKEEPKLKDYQKAVGGLIELVRYIEDDEFEIIVNEEGFFLEQSFNLLAYMMTGYQLHGNVLVLRKGVLK